MDVYRPMRDEDVAKLRHMLNIREPMALPESIVSAYWVFRGFLDRSGSQAMSDDLLTVLCYLSNLRVPRDAGAEIVKAVKEERVKRGDKLLVVWREEFKQATFHALNANGRIEAVLDGDDNPVPRQFDPFDVEVMDTSLQTSQA